MAAAKKRNVLVAVVLGSVVCGMVGLAFAAVPLYKLFCSLTGVSGTTRRVAAADAPKMVDGPKITVSFDSNVAGDLDWRFRPEQRSVAVKPGEQAIAFYSAENLSAQPVTGTASFNVTPYKAAIYFNKIQCFCFTKQTLGAGQKADMTVQFYVDPKILTDPNTKEVRNITLSYTMYRSPDQSDARKTSALDRRGDKTRS